MDEPTLRGPARLLQTLALSGLALTVVLVLAPGTASAHAELAASDPSPGAVLAAAPGAVTVTFGESVEVGDGAIEVYDGDRARADVGPLAPVGPGHAGLRVALRPGLARGSYTVRWHVSASDTHPASGSFGFAIGAPSSDARALSGSGRNDAAGLLLGLLRWTGYAGLVLGPGVLLVALWLWPAGLADRRTRRLAGWGLALLGLSTLGGMLLQGVWADGGPISALWAAPGTLDTHSHRFDVVYAARGYLLVGFAVALAAALNSAGGSRTATPPARRLLLLGTVITTIALEATWPLVGHSASGSPVAVALVANLLHTFAMTVWLGGLVLVLVGLRSAGHPAELAAVLPRFSRLALAAVATLVASGTLLSIREVGSVRALATTTFGLVLSTKLVGVVALLVLGNIARSWVARSPLTADVTGLRRGMAGEVVVAAAVLALTAALVVVVPARQEAARDAGQTATR